MNLGYRKRAMAEVWISNGNGQIAINDIPIVEYFRKQEDRYQTCDRPMFMTFVF
jgi:ribosomal protein S9